MSLRKWLALTLMLLGVLSGIAFWHVSLTLHSGGLTFAVQPDSFIHDASITVPGLVPAAGVFFGGLALLLLPRPGRGKAEPVAHPERE